MDMTDKDQQSDKLTDRLETLKEQQEYHEFVQRFEAKEGRVPGAMDGWKAGIVHAQQDERFRIWIRPEVDNPAGPTYLVICDDLYNKFEDSPDVNGPGRKVLAITSDMDTAEEAMTSWHEFLNAHHA